MSQETVPLGGGVRQSCDRCGRASGELTYDEISRKVICADCLDELERRRLARQRLESDYGPFTSPR